MIERIEYKLKRPVILNKGMDDEKKIDAISYRLPVLNDLVDLARHEDNHHEHMRKMIARLSDQDERIIGHMNGYDYYVIKERINRFLLAGAIEDVLDKKEIQE